MGKVTPLRRETFVESPATSYALRLTHDAIAAPAKEPKPLSSVRSLWFLVGLTAGMIAAAVILMVVGAVS